MKINSLNQITFILFIILLPLYTNAQSWEKKFEHPGSLAKGFDVVETSDGGYVMCGEVDLPTGAIRHYTWVVKTDAAGNQQWSRIYNYNDISNDEARALVETNDGGFLIAGINLEFKARLLHINADGDSLWTKVYPAEGIQAIEDIVAKQGGDGYLMVGRKTLDPVTNHQSFYVLSLDHEGVLLWEETYEELNGLGSGAAAIKATANGEFILAGNYNGYELVVLRIAATGEQIWAKKYGLSKGDWGLAIEEMENGEILVGGFSTGFAGFSPLLLHLNSNGEPMINQPFLDVISFGAVTDIEKDTDGGFILVGSGFSFWDNIAMQNGYILKLNSDLQPVWDSLLSNTNVQGTAIVPTSDNGYIMSGFDDNKMLLKKIAGMTNAIEESYLEKELAVMVYPNPTTEKIIFEWPEEAITASLLIELYSPDGQLFLTQSVDECIEVIQLNCKTQGAYTYVVKSKEVVLQSGFVLVM
jgi:outer membrane protein assembly factor BamB